MGAHYTCDRISRSCPWSQEGFRCIYWSDDGDPGQPYDTCTASPRSVGLQVLLPLSLIITIGFTIYVFSRYRRLKRIREVHLRGNFSALTAMEHGKYAAGVAEWDCGSDIVPFIAPQCCKTCCITEGADIKSVVAVSIGLFIVGIILLPIGLFTRDAGRTDDGNLNAQGLSTAAFICAFVGGCLLCVACIARACGSRALLRQKRTQELNQLRAEAFGLPAPAVVIMPNQFVQQQPMQMYMQQPGPSIVQAQPIYHQPQQMHIVEGVPQQPLINQHYHSTSEGPQFGGIVGGPARDISPSAPLPAVSGQYQRF